MSFCPFGSDEITKLKTFVSFCSASPQILNNPQLNFIKEFIEKLGGKVPAGEFNFTCGANETKQKDPKKDNEPKQEGEEDSEPESDIELDMTGVIEGDSTEQPTEQDIELADEYRSKASVAYSEQNYQEAIDLYTKAILLNSGNALFHAKRGQTFLKLLKPNACIRDCNRALELNCDSAAAYKFRGRAHRLLGNWELAVKDLRQACKLDFDEEADEWLKEVTPNAKKLEQHKLKQERKKAERELRKRQERLRKAQEQQKQQQQSTNPTAGGDTPNSGTTTDTGPKGMPGGMPNFNPDDLRSAFNDPEVAAAMQDIMANPGNIIKYQSNPKIMNLMKKIEGVMGGAGGAGGFPGFPFGGAGGGSFPGFPTAADTNPKPTENSRKDFSDDGLD